MLQQVFMFFFYFKKAGNTQMMYYEWQRKNGRNINRIQIKDLAFIFKKKKKSTKDVHLVVIN